MAWACVEVSAHGLDGVGPELGLPAGSAQATVAGEILEGWLEPLRQGQGDAASQDDLGIVALAPERPGEGRSRLREPSATHGLQAVEVVRQGRRARGRGGRRTSRRIAWRTTCRPGRSTRRGARGRDWPSQRRGRRLRRGLDRCGRRVPGPGRGGRRSRQVAGPSPRPVHTGHDQGVGVRNLIVPLVPPCRGLGRQGPSASRGLDRPAVPRRGALERVCAVPADVPDEPLLSAPL